SNKTNIKNNHSAFFYFESSCRLPFLALLLLLIVSTVVLIVGKQREVQNAINIMIVNLSLSDIIVCVMSIPFTIIYTLMDHWIFRDFTCKVTSYVQSVSICASIFSLVLIAIERYQGWKIRVSHTYWAIMLIWLFSLLLSIPFLLSFFLTNEPFQNFCLPTDLYPHWVACPSKMNQLLFTTSLFTLFILVCYLKIVTCLHRRNGKIDKKRESESWLRENKRINMMLISTVVSFEVCWLLLNIFNVIFVRHLIAMASACINPLFYGFLNKNFQKDLMLLIHHCCVHLDEYKGSLRLAHTSTSI
ncbi:hypothetical protein K5549_020281, partial [Capra hircus]|uniref:G-protein coupled receptors family 1 profile domain-containing protein n=1 Tax=Capra hircus TaxID=9925 RepID=A0A452FFT7_CAPHI